VSAVAWRMRVKTQSSSPTNRSSQHFLGMFDSSNYPAGCKAVCTSTKPLKERPKIFQKPLVKAAQWVTFPVPNENWALWRAPAMLTRV
jgi:hypothetical protein